MFSDMQMFEERKQLPVYSFREELCNKIAASRVTIVRGATGCGKTTQIPQYVLDQYIGGGSGAQCGIIVTQVCYCILAWCRHLGVLLPGHMV